MKTSRITYLVALGTLHVLASPIYLARWLSRAQAVLPRVKALATGGLRCPHCGFENPLDVLATCGSCGRAEFGSRLYCTLCGEVSTAFACDGCTATIVVFR